MTGLVLSTKLGSRSTSFHRRKRIILRIWEDAEPRMDPASAGIQTGRVSERGIRRLYEKAPPTLDEQHTPVTGVTFATGTPDFEYDWSRCSQCKNSLDPEGIA